MSNVEKVLRTLDETVALRTPLNGDGEEMYRIGVAMVERWGRLAAITDEYGVGATECMIALLTAEPHYSFKYQPILKELTGSPPGTPNDYDGNDVVTFWRSWIASNAKPEYAQVDWRPPCPRVTLANDAYACPGIDDQMQGFVEEDDPVIRYALARNPAITEQIWALLVLSPEEDIRFELLLQRVSEPTVLQIFSEDRSSLIRTRVASELKTPAAALAHLAHDTERSVREALLRRESLPEPILSYLADCGDEVIQEGAGRRLRVAAYRDELFEALRTRKAKVVEDLLTKERSLAEVTYTGRLTPLHLAAFPPAKETSYLIVRSLARAGGRSNTPDAFGDTACQLASRAPQPIGAKMTKFMGCGNSTAHVETPEILIREPGETTDMLNAKLESIFERESTDLIAETWRQLYDRLVDVLLHGGIAELQATTWLPQAPDCVPFILHTRGIWERLLAKASGTDVAEAEAARDLLFAIVKVPIDSQVAPQSLFRNPLFIWGGAVLDSLFVESELEQAAEAVLAMNKKSDQQLEMLTVIGQVVALGHLVAQFVPEAPVERFVRFSALAGYHFKITSQERVVADYVDPMWQAALPGAPTRSPATRPVLESGQLAVIPGRNDYLAYLQENELSEDSVLGILPNLDAEGKRKVNQVLMTALESGNESLVRSVQQASASNTNVLLAEINRRLVQRFAEHGVLAATEVYAGVFPTNSFNAHVVHRAERPLILVNTGAFELLEGAVVPFSLLKPGSARQQAQVLAKLVRQYCEERTLPRGDQFEDFEFDGDRHKFGVHLLTAAEDFILAHEYGHLASGHVGNAVAELTLNGGRSIQVPDREWDEEYEADRWATQALVSSPLDQASDEEQMVICSGALLFLSVAALVEAYQAKLGLRFDTHPPAVSRYTEIRKALAKAGLNRHTHLGVTFRNFCAIVAEELDLHWDRDEGVTLIIDEMGRLVDDGLKAAVPIRDQRETETVAKVTENPRRWWQILKQGVDSE